MTRVLNTNCLDTYARQAAGWWLQDVAPFDRAWLKKEFFRFTFKDEWDHLVKAVEANMAGDSAGSFKSMIDALVDAKPRTEKVLANMLSDRLAVDLDGVHIPGKIGSVIVAGRIVGKRLSLKGYPKNAYWNVYAGEGDERAIDSGVADELPLHAEPLPVGALNTRISNEVAQLLANAGEDNLDEGSAGATIQGRTGSQPADPDTVVSGTNLFTLTCSATAFGAASDAAPGALKTANSITQDSSADATGTLGYCRASSSNAADTPLDDHIDGEAGTAGADFNFNTLSIVSGSSVSMTSWTVTMPES